MKKCVAGGGTVSLSSSLGERVRARDWRILGTTGLLDKGGTASNCSLI